MDGNYKLENIKPGDYSIKVSFIGYTDALFNGVSLKKNETKKLNVKLQLRSNTLQEVIVVGERVVDLESGKSEINIDRETIKEMAVRDVQDIVKMQAGVSENPDGIQIRGGRVYETQYVVDGISAQDPLAGTGFGVNVSSSSVVLYFRTNLSTNPIRCEVMPMSIIEPKTINSSAMKIAM